MRRAFVITVATLAGCASPGEERAEGPVPITREECSACFAGTGQCCRDDLEGRPCATDATCYVRHARFTAFDQMWCVEGRWSRGGTTWCNPPPDTSIPEDTSFRDVAEDANDDSEAPDPTDAVGPG